MKVLEIVWAAPDKPKITTIPQGKIACVELQRNGAIDVHVTTGSMVKLTKESVENYDRIYRWAFSCK